MLSPSQAALYRRLTLGDVSLMTTLFSTADRTSDVLDDRTAALVRLAVLIAVDADAPAYQCEVTAAISAGASPEQITDVLVVIARIAGSALVMSAAPKLALAMGYDVDDGMENDRVRAKVRRSRRTFTPVSSRENHRATGHRSDPPARRGDRHQCALGDYSGSGSPTSLAIARSLTRSDGVRASAAAALAPLPAR